MLLTNVQFTDQQGFVIRENDFDAYGNQVREQDWTSDNFPTEFGGSQNDLLFSTKERDFSIGLDYFGFRYYDAVLGKFTTRDPSGYPDGPNNYLYCRNNPINSIDPLGLRELKEGERHLTEDEQFAIKVHLNDMLSSYDKNDGISKILNEVHDVWSEKTGKPEFQIIVYKEKNAPGSRGFFSISMKDGSMTLALNESLFENIKNNERGTRKHKNAQVRLLGAVVHETVHYLQKKGKVKEILKENRAKLAAIDKMNLNNADKDELKFVSSYLTSSKLSSMDGEYEAHMIHLAAQDIYFRQITGDNQVAFFENDVLRSWESNYYDPTASRSYGANGSVLLQPKPDN